MTDSNDKTGQRIENLPILPLRNSVFFPGTIMPIIVGRPKTIALLKALEKDAGLLGVVTQHDKHVDDPLPEQLYYVGTTARIIKLTRENDQTYHIVVQGYDRFRISQFRGVSPFLTADVDLIGEENPTDIEIDVLTTNLKRTASEVVHLVPEIPDTAIEMLDQVQERWQLINIIVSNLNADVDDKMTVLETYDLKTRLKKTIALLQQQLEVLRISDRINSEIKGEMSKSQKDFILRQQLKAIKRELGELDEDFDGLEELEERLLKAQLPSQARKVADKELARLRTIQPSSPEYTVARTYLDWLADLPWVTQTEDNLSTGNARQVLDRDHYDLVQVKRRILEYLAVRQLKRDMKGPILCLVGPPGVGKTSLGQSIADALGRKFIRISLGGVRDEAEIRGHRRTYIGAMPGKIIQSMKRTGTVNPVFVLDEIDKLSADWRGDPASACLELLDPEQNHSFMDHYLDVPYDLSKVMFIATANATDTIPPPLLDRMEVIEIPGYVQEEKVEIAKQHLIPKQIREHGLKLAQVKLSDDVVMHLINHYTREAGVRNLERQVATLCRSVAVGVVEGRFKRATVTKKLVSDWLGPEKFVPEMKDRLGQPGVATGLAWTRYGGEILFIEATRMRGSGKVRLTGQLGDVMKESAEIALSTLRTRAAEFGIPEDEFDKTDVHVHIPAGAIPKDGPSAGVTMFTALVSLFIGERVRDDLAMTGELTLRGLVLPVGGIKDKVLAARRSGIEQILLPERNRKDLADVPENARKDLTFHFVETIDDVLRLALVDPKKLSAKRKRRSKAVTASA
ncbi:MAG: endopeptidase La [Myxococcales bacterium]|nr:endopeptidase La [Myxococcales bacterium]